MTALWAFAPSRCLGVVESIRRIWLLARMTFREALRKKLFWVVGALTALFVCCFGWGVFHFKVTWNGRVASPRSRMPITFDQAADLNVAFAIFIIFFLAGGLGIFAAAGTIAGEADGGTFQAILTKPIHRWEVVIGKWLGHAVMLALYVAVSTMVVSIEAGLITGHVTVGVWKAILVVIVATWWLLALTILGSAIFATAANGIICYAIHAFGVAATILEGQAQVIGSHTLENAGLIGSLVFPSQRIYNYANYLVQPTTNYAFGGGGTSSLPPSGAIMPFAMIYLALLLLAACRVFYAKDL